LYLHSSFLTEVLRRAEERTDDFEEKLRASEAACEKAEKDAASVEDLRQRLQAAEDALSDREAKFIQRDNDIITHLEMQSKRFSSDTISPFVVQLPLPC
jgi:vacuolar-type H+-ATPase subunit E/Vma4